MEGASLISSDVLASYAADAAREVDGVRGLVDGALPRHRAVRITTDRGAVAVELHLVLEWGANAADVGAAVQARVADYLDRMAEITPRSVDVVVDEIAHPRA